MRTSFELATTRPGATHCLTCLTSTARRSGRLGPPFLAWQDGTAPPVIELRGMPVSIDRICGLLWQCEDMRPFDLIDALGEHAPPGRPLRHLTYASGARLLRLLYQRALLARAERAVWAAS